MQPLSRLEQIEMMFVKTLKNMGGQILGYNSRKCNEIVSKIIRRRKIGLGVEVSLNTFCIWELAVRQP